MSPSILRTALVLAASAVALEGTSASAQAQTLDLAVLGDSYAAGVGAGNPGIAPCRRHSNGWGPLYARHLRDRGMTVNLTYVACGGAVTKDLDAQIKAITPQTDLVLLTIGGNDVGFSKIVMACFAPVLADPGRCRSAISAAKRGLATTQAAVLAQMDVIRARMRPGGKVGLLSYPYLARPYRYVLRSFTDAFDGGAAVRAFQDVADQANRASTADVNREAGYDIATFIETKDLFVGHEPDQDPFKQNKSTWINEIDLAKIGGAYHPNAAGYRSMTEAIERVAGPDGAFGVAQ